jgi:hypothetical protein
MTRTKIRVTFLLSILTCVSGLKAWEVRALGIINCVQVIIAAVIKAA